MKNRQVYVPTEEEFQAGLRAYAQNESRGPVYFVALQQLARCGGEAQAMANTIWILLKSWHKQFYQFGKPDLSALAKCVEDHRPMLQALRGRAIDTLCYEDEDVIKDLFYAFTTATRRHNTRGAQESTVATAKALHLLAPGFLPLWDNRIAWHYGEGPMIRNYLTFCWQMKELANAVSCYVNKSDDRTLLKRLDEFNYSAYTKFWIKVGSAT